MISQSLHPDFSISEPPGSLTILFFRFLYLYFILYALSRPAGHWRYEYTIPMSYIEGRSLSTFFFIKSRVFLEVIILFGYLHIVLGPVETGKN